MHNALYKSATSTITTNSNITNKVQTNCNPDSVEILLLTLYLTLNACSYINAAGCKCITMPLVTPDLHII